MVPPSARARPPPPSSPSYPMTGNARHCCARDSRDESAECGAGQCIRRRLCKVRAVFEASRARCGGEINFVGAVLVRLWAERLTVGEGAVGDVISCRCASFRQRTSARRLRSCRSVPIRCRWWRLLGPRGLPLDRRDDCVAQPEGEGLGVGAGEAVGQEGELTAAKPGDKAFTACAVGEPRGSLDEDGVAGGVPEASRPRRWHAWTRHCAPFWICKDLALAAPRL